MNWKSQLLNELHRLAPLFTEAEPASLSVLLPHGRLVADVQAVDALACSIRRMSLQTPELADANVGQLNDVASRLSRRLTYLLEPIQTIESDAADGVVQLRSKPPLRDEQGTRYYEVLARRGGEILLIRYQKAPHESRRVVPATFTIEVLCRLAQDLSDALE